ncbi:unnamed protein product [Albugo candida]|uniref:Uncharacterized protein n=1 Tax=Albugo candida TaxID=65357 RepID=A0A024GTS6_9STRA|nr:unnamed protein product [Albugo candida]|eukprot:CCI50130.1 unnamed protein product [Albugo candida]
MAAAFVTVSVEHKSHTSESTWSCWPLKASIVLPPRDPISIIYPSAGLNGMSLLTEHEINENQQKQTQYLQQTLAFMHKQASDSARKKNEAARRRYEKKYDVRTSLFFIGRVLTGVATINGWTHDNKKLLVPFTTITRHLTSCNLPKICGIMNVYKWWEFDSALFLDCKINPDMHQWESLPRCKFFAVSLAHQQEYSEQAAENLCINGSYSEAQPSMESTCLVKNCRELRDPAGIMRTEFPHHVMTYLEQTGLIYKDRFVDYLLRGKLHFGNTTTSRVEGAHATLKNWIRASSGDLLTVETACKLAWEGQLASIRQQTALDRATADLQFGATSAAVMGKISGTALNLTFKQCPQRQVAGECSAPASAALTAATLTAAGDLAALGAADEWKYPGWPTDAWDHI